MSIRTQEVTTSYRLGTQTIYKPPTRLTYPLSKEDKDWIDRQRSSQDTLHSLRIQLMGLIRSNHPDIPEKSWRMAFNNCLSNVYPKEEKDEKE